MKKLITLSVLSLFILTGCFGSVPSGKYDEFAKCLTDNGAVEYGAFWCPNCAKQKKLFGDSFQHIKYIECDPRGDDPQSQLCLDKKIDKYPTWDFENGDRIVGLTPLEDLAEKAGCEEELENSKF